jgi:molecular chaperone HscA
LLEAGERATIELACERLEEAARGEDPSRIHALIESLDDATKPFAGRRMNRAIARAIEGRRIEAVEKSVEHAKGIEEAHVR